jgi:chemotaxis protein MotB
MRRPVKAHARGQTDHADAWLMSYADLITLLFMFFVILVSAAVTKHDPAAQHDPAQPAVQQHSGLLAVKTPYDEMYGALLGTINSHKADQDVAVQRSEGGMWIDISAVPFFKPGEAAIPATALPLLKAMAHDVKNAVHGNDTIAVESYTDDAPLVHSAFANNWELAAMRAAKVTGLLIDEGIDPARLRAVNYGANHPVVPNDDSAGNPIVENHNRNQRIIIRVQHPRVLTGEPDDL